MKTQVIASFNLCRLVPRLTTNLRLPALACERFELVQVSSQVLFELVKTCDTIGKKVQAEFIALDQTRRKSSQVLTCHDGL